ncbi:NTPase [Kaistia sp. 32K]|uniref:KAP family P-loop NTPase fold protein n=1 Tax=Kaistia sp. 32K TaxID=2795690 RepID=UPI00191523A9|nr:P-loop NTPase fold protein [Kaistia sp. 32K]BCP52788.1 NTPase [Kaistia sp. 32K]
MKGDEYKLGDDQPKRNVADDRLGYAPFAKRLANVIINMNVPNGYVIGLHGSWGAGKTTVVNFILEHIKEHNEEAVESTKIEHIDFRPWIVSGHQDLIAAFFKLLSEHLKPREGTIKKIYNRALRATAGGADDLVHAAATMALAIDPSGGAISGLVGNAGKKALKSVFGKFLDTPSLQTAYENLRGQLSNSNRCLLVTIDDIDRLEDGEIRSIMQMVKTIGRLPNVTYLLVYDREIVWRALDGGIDRVGPRFAEKIVQQELHLPLPGKNSLLTMLGDEIASITADGETSPRWQYIVRDGVHRWINYPRDVLRLSNALKFAWPALRGEFDSQDLVAIEGLRLFDPVAFDWVRRNRDFLFNEGRYLMGADDDRKANIKALKASLPPATVDPVIELLAVLFPDHVKWFEGERYVIRESHFASQARRGLMSEAGYDAYFALHPSADAVPKATIDAVFDNLNDEMKLTNSLRTYIGKNNSRGRAMIGLFLDELRMRFSVQPKPQPTQGLLNALLSIGDEVFAMPWRGEMFTLEPGSYLRILLRDLLEVWGEEEAGKHLIAAYQQSGSPFVLADLFVDRARELGVFPSDDPGRAVISQKDFERLGVILMPKIKAAADDGSLGDLPFYWKAVLSWNHLGDPAALQEWLRKGIEADGRFTAKVVRGLVSQSSSGDGIHYIYRRDADQYVYDRDVIYNNAKRHLSESNELTDDERALLRALVDGVDRMQAGNSGDRLGDAEDE